jgi:hemoglobin
VRYLTVLKDIATENDIKQLVDSFYERVGRDELLGPVFNEIARVNWEDHLPTMYSFWSTMLFRTASYKGRPWPRHAPLPVRKEHFDRWVSLFCQTVDSLFSGAKANEAKSAALSIADTFQTRFGIFNPFLFQHATGARREDLKLLAREES